MAAILRFMSDPGEAVLSLTTLLHPSVPFQIFRREQFLAILARVWARRLEFAHALSELALRGGRL